MVEQKSHDISSRRFWIIIGVIVVFGVLNILWVSGVIHTRECATMSTLRDGMDPGLTHTDAGDSRAGMTADEYETLQNAQTTHSDTMFQDLSHQMERLTEHGVKELAQMIRKHSTDIERSVDRFITIRRVESCPEEDARVSRETQVGRVLDASRATTPNERMTHSPSSSDGSMDFDVDFDVSTPFPSPLTDRPYREPVPNAGDPRRTHSLPWADSVRTVSSQHHTPEDQDTLSIEVAKTLRMMNYGATTVYETKPLTECNFKLPDHLSHTAALLIEARDAHNSNERWKSVLVVESNIFSTADNADLEHAFSWIRQDIVRTAEQRAETVNGGIVFLWNDGACLKHAVDPARRTRNITVEQIVDTAANTVKFADDDEYGDSDGDEEEHDDDTISKYDAAHNETIQSESRILLYREKVVSRTAEEPESESKEDRGPPTLNANDKLSKDVGACPLNYVVYGDARTALSYKLFEECKKIADREDRDSAVSPNDDDDGDGDDRDRMEENTDVGSDPILTCNIQTDLFLCCDAQRIAIYHILLGR